VSRDKASAQDVMAVGGSGSAVHRARPALWPNCGKLIRRLSAEE